jgi:polyisoprenoid-binding protein YceI
MLSLFRRHRRPFVLGLGLFLILALAGGGYGLWYILIGPTGPAAVTPIVPAANVAAPASLDGQWTVNTSLGSLGDGTASFAGFRVQEQLVGVGGHTAVGRSVKVEGSLTLAGASLSQVQITVDMTGLTSDDPLRDQQLAKQAIETNQYPSATFNLTTPLDLGSLPAENKILAFQATGDLTLHGVTKTVTISLQAQRVGGIIAVAGSLPIIFSDWQIQKPNSFSILSVDDHGIMEFHLLFTHS